MSRRGKQLRRERAKDNGQHPKFPKQRLRRPPAVTATITLVGHDPRRIWREGEPLIYAKGAKRGLAAQMAREKVLRLKGLPT